MLPEVVNNDLDASHYLYCINRATPTNNRHAMPYTSI